MGQKCLYILKEYIILYMSKVKELDFLLGAKKYTGFIASRTYGSLAHEL